MKEGRIDPLFFRQFPESKSALIFRTEKSLGFRKGHWHNYKEKKSTQRPSKSNQVEGDTDVSTDH